MKRSVAAAVLLTLTACGAEPAADDAPQRYTADITVLQNARHGPQLCATVAESDPPQCGGPDIVGWDWEAVEHTSRRGVRWGSYRVVGTWDGDRLTLTLTEPARPSLAAPAVPRDEPRASCVAPERGVDPAKARQRDLDEALRQAAATDDFAGAWLGWNPGDMSDDPRRTVLNLAFTGDPGERETWIRRVWGGALCVTRAEYTERELGDIQDRVMTEVKGVHSAHVDIKKNRAMVGVWTDTPQLRHELDKRYGKNVVLVEPHLQPVG